MLWIWLWCQNKTSISALLAQFETDKHPCCCFHHVEYLFLPVLCLRAAIWPFFQCQWQQSPKSKLVHSRGCYTRTFFSICCYKDTAKYKETHETSVKIWLWSNMVLSNLTTSCWRDQISVCLRILWRVQVHLTELIQLTRTLVAHVKRVQLMDHKLMCFLHFPSQRRVELQRRTCSQHFPARPSPTITPSLR